MNDKDGTGSEGCGFVAVVVGVDDFVVGCFLLLLTERMPGDDDDDDVFVVGDETATEVSHPTHDPNDHPSSLKFLVSNNQLSLLLRHEGQMQRMQ